MRILPYWISSVSLRTVSWHNLEDGDFLIANLQPKKKRVAARSRIIHLLTPGFAATWARAILKENTCMHGRMYCTSEANEVWGICHFHTQTHQLPIQTNQQRLIQITILVDGLLWIYEDYNATALSFFIWFYIEFYKVFKFINLSLFLRLILSTPLYRSIHWKCAKAS